MARDVRERQTLLPTHVPVDDRREAVPASGGARGRREAVTRSALGAERAPRRRVKV